jgi:xanthine dehydrogenase accessory factor
MRDLHEYAARLSASHEPFGVATVVRTQGSTPQVVGAKLVVTSDETRRPVGTLGGGCVEADAILAAREALATGGRSLRAYQLTEDLVWNTGLVCGGTMWILAERGEEAMTCDGVSMSEAVAAAARGGAPIAWVTKLRREARGFSFDARMFVAADGETSGSIGEPAADARAVSEALLQMRHGTPRVLTIDDEHDLLVEPVTARPRLVIGGGGHVARAIAQQAGLLDFDVTILEDRAEFADPSRFDGAAVINQHVPTAIAQFDYGWQSYLVIATRGHKLDADCVLAAIKTTVPYIGLLGSRRKAVLVAQMLREEGIDESRIDVIHSPVGLDLGGRTPAEIALSVMAEITRERYQGSGQSLRGRGLPA